ncbi:MAG: methenyltetrahydromethanopterin cyclohydrolase [Pirellulaceae bacterium]
MTSGAGLNQAAHAVFATAARQASELRIAATELPCGAHVLDFGVHVPGGIEAGLRMASICMADRATVSITTGDREVWAGPWVQVATDHPIDACMLSQYAGWPVKVNDFFAMGSGPMRVRRGREELLKSLDATEVHCLAVGTLECDTLPSCEVAAAIAADCNVPEQAVWLAVAPTRCIAGCVQVVARSVETSLHQLFELGFPLRGVRSAYGSAPLPPPTPDFGAGIGRTNDAILYGGHVTLWVEADDELIADVGPKLPSLASRDYGAPFADIFKRYGYDFYKVDPALFSPAQVVVVNLRSGRSWRFGELREDLVASSFATELT